MLNKRSFSGPTVPSFVLAFVFSTSFASSSLISDEVFLVFENSRHLYTHWFEVFAGAWNSSAEGWDKGRYVTPILHFIGNLGLFSVYWFSDFFFVDLLVAYGVARGIAFGLAIATVVHFVWTFFPASVPKYLRSLLALAAGAIIISTMASTAAYSSIRSNPWTYSAVVAIVFVLLSVTSFVAKQASQPKPSRIVGLVVIGALFGSTYEFTVALGPVALVVFVASRAMRSPDPLHWKNLRRAALNWEFGALLSSFTLTGLIIQLHNFWICQRANCYPAAEIAPGGLETGVALERIVSASPVFSLSFATSQIPGFWGDQKYLSLAATILAVTGILAVLLGRHLTRSLSLSKELLQDRALLVLPGSALVAIGSVMSVILAFGIASTGSLQTGFSLELGESYVDTLGQNVAHGLTASGAVIIIIGLLIRRTLWLRVWITLVLALSSLGTSLAYTTNVGITEISHAADGVFLQQRFASELQKPDLTPKGNRYRCELIRRKTSDFSAWHDDAIIDGLNGTMAERFGVRFCDEQTNYVR